MEHIDIEKKIHEIRNALDNELKQANAIDSAGHATNKELFEHIIDEKIKEINQLEPMIADEMGVARDRYASNIFMHQIELLNEMKKRHAVTYEPNLPKQDIAIERTEKTSKKQTFVNGIKKLLQKITGRKKAMENSR